MSERESLADKAVAAVAAVAALETMLGDVNDYGEATGYRYESDQICNDLHAQLGMIRARATWLRHRYERAQRDAAAAPQSETPPGEGGAT